VLQVQFLGIEEGADPKNLPPGTLVRADNCAMDKERRLVKRDGGDGLVKTALSGSNITSAKRLLGPGTKLTDGQTAWAYADSLAKWSPIDRPPPWRVTKRPLVDSTRSVSGVDIAISGDLLVTMYQTGVSGLYVRVDQVSTGQVLLVPTLLATSGEHPRVLVSGGTAYLLHSDTLGQLWCDRLDLASFVLSASVALKVDARVGTATQFDAVIGEPTATGVSTLYLAYELNAGASRMNIASFTLSTLAAISSLASVGTTLRAVCIAFGGGSQRVSVAFSSATSVLTRVTTCTSALGGQVGPTTVYAGISEFVLVDEDDATNILVGWERNDGSGTDADRLTTALYSVAAIAQVATSERITFGVYNPCKPWRVAGRWYVSVMTWVHPYSVTSQDAISQPSTVVLEIETATSLTGSQDSTHPHVATLQNYTGWFGPGLGQTKTAAAADGATWLASPYRNREPENYAARITVGWDAFRLAAAEGDTFRPTTIGASALCACGAPFWSDSASTMPLGFAHAPQIISVSAVAGGAMAVGVYSYVATYAWRDVNGVLHRSAPSPPKTGTTAGANLTLVVRVATSSVSAKVRTLLVGTAPNPVFIELWRTTVGGVAPHFRLSLEPSHQVLINDARAGDVTLNDTKADADIGGGLPSVPLNTQAQLYTDAGELDNIPPPSLITHTTHRGRIAGIGPDLRTVWFSKDSTEDSTIAPGFNEALTLSFATDKTALFSLDAGLIVLGEDTIDVVHGDGPDNTGGGLAWQIQGVQTDVGCVNPRSVVVFPGGGIFESRKGLSLIDRQLNVTWLGNSVTDLLATYPTITSGVLVASKNEVRWTCDDGETGIVLVYDYLHRIWFARKYTDTSDTLAASVRFVDAKLDDGVYTLLTAGGQVYRETSAHHLDGSSVGSYVERDVLLAPISSQPGRAGWSNANMGWSRMKDVTLMGTSQTPHDIEVSFAQDFSSAFNQTKRFNSGTEVTTPGPLEKCRVTLTRQKCAAVQIRIRDLAPTDGNIGTGAGPILEALALRVSTIDGLTPTGAGRRG
jgi:hypothetical protein